MDNILRIVVVYLFLMVVLRALGKRELSEMSPFDLVTLLLIPEIVSDSLIAEDHSLTASLVGVCTLLTLVALTSFLTYRFKRARKVIEGRLSVLVRDGKFQEETMHRERIECDDIYAEMRRAGIDDLHAVRWAILETDGKISIVPTRHQQADDDRKV
jgi:uncharacterized membrane protein YcaP (DUF421 family)